MTLLRRSLAVAGGALAALTPALALAAEGAGRTLPRSAGDIGVIAATLGAVIALILIATLGWLYQQRRNLHWRFQDSDAPAPDHH